MKKEDRLIIGKQQLKNYLASQYPKWRYVQILTISKILKNLRDFYRDDIEDIKQPYDMSGEITINKEVKNGLIFSALAETIQYIEDLFSLMKFSKNIEYFVKNVIKYNATTIYQYIKTFKIEDLKFICEEYQIPYFNINEEWRDYPELFFIYKEAILNLQQNITKIVEFYKKYESFYLQYKHGLTVALNPFGSEQPSLLDINEGYLMIYDKVEISKIMASKKQKMILIPHLTQEVAKSVSQLNQEENLLRAEISTICIEELLELSKNICELLQILHTNLINICDNTEKQDFHNFCLPYKKDNKYATMGFPVKE